MNAKFRSNDQEWGSILTCMNIICNHSYMHRWLNLWIGNEDAHLAYTHTWSRRMIHTLYHQTLTLRYHILCTPDAGGPWSESGVYGDVNEVRDSWDTRIYLQNNTILCTLWSICVLTNTCNSWSYLQYILYNIIFKHTVDLWSYIHTYISYVGHNFYLPHIFKPLKKNYFKKSKPHLFI